MQKRPRPHRKEAKDGKDSKASEVPQGTAAAPAGHARGAGEHTGVEGGRRTEVDADVVELVDTLS